MRECEDREKVGKKDRRLVNNKGGDEGEDENEKEDEDNGENLVKLKVILWVKLRPGKQNFFSAYVLPKQVSKSTLTS